MKTKLLLFFAFITLGITAQTTHQLEWSFASADQNLTIEVGDTVVWTWVGASTHNLVKLTGPETGFGADEVRYAEGYEYTYIFTTEGINTYECTPHPASMYGTITVTEALGIDDVVVSEFTFFPNPVNNVLSIKAQASIDGITIFNMLGQAVVRSTPNTTDSTVDMSALQTGAYFVQVSINNTLKTVRVIKN